MDLERRELLRELSLLLAGLAAASCRPDPKAREPSPDAGPPAGPPPGRAFLPPQRQLLEVATWRVLPSDADPGAQEAGVIEYIDRELARPEYDRLKKLMLSGLVALNRVADQRAKKLYLDLSPAEQEEVLRIVQDQSERGADFVKTLVLLTLEGFVGDPRWGGNKDGVGWKFLGYGPGNPDGSGTGAHAYGGHHHH